MRSVLPKTKDKVQATETQMEAEDKVSFLIIMLFIYCIMHKKKYKVKLNSAYNLKIHSREKVSKEIEKGI